MLVASDSAEFQKKFVKPQIGRMEIDMKIWLCTYCNRRRLSIFRPRKGCCSARECDAEGKAQPHAWVIYRLV